jgi:formylglycine-generating enzyme required for sulfatase activity
VVVDPVDADLPTVGVNWFGAKAYAEHFGMRLPTEHEWEIAAKGNLVDYVYPWGMTIEQVQANYNGLGNNPPPPGVLLPIGSYPAWPSEPFGLLDVCGNVKEWTKDWYGPYEEGQVVNPPGPIFGTLRVVRGGSYLTTAAGVRVTAREATDPTITSSQIGFRTAFTDTMDTR